jgi:hypothetical protein
MEEVNLFTNNKNSENDNDDDGSPIVPPEVPLSPMKKTEQVETILDEYDDEQSKLLALAQIMKKDRK